MTPPAIPEHQLLRDHYRFLSDLNDRLRHEGDPHVILRETVHRLAAHLGVSRTGYGEFDEDAAFFMPREHWTDGNVVSIDHPIPFASFGPAIVASHRAGELWVHESLDDPKLDEAGREACRALGIVAVITVPVLKDGRLRSLISVQQNRPRHWKPGELALVSALADSTWATLERVRAEEARAESEALLGAILAHAPIGIYLKDGEGRFKLVNDTMTRLLGRTRDALIGRTAGDLFARDTAMQADAADRATLAGGVPRTSEAPAPAGAGYQFGMTTRFPVETRSGRELAGFLTDITDRKRADAELARSRETLYQTEKMAALGSLLAGVSHELNNPLATIVAQAELLAAEAEGTPAARRIGRIRRAAEQSARIVQTFLAMARQKAPNRAPTDLGRVIDAVIELLRYGLVAAKVTVAVDHAPGLPAITADADQLHQVIVNLVVNAQQAMEAAPVPRVLTLRTAHDAAAGVVTLTVADTGPGIPEAIRRRIFEPFFTTKPEGVGTGVGLSFSQGIVEAHDGRLDLIDTGTQGTTFRVTLPVGTAAAKVDTGDTLVETPPPPRRRALVIDDEPDVADSLADVLTFLGFEAGVAYTVAAAKGAIDAGGFDLIVSDFRMPDLDGGALYDWLRGAHPALVRAFAFSTGDTLGGVAQEHIARSGRPILEKPFTVATVRALAAQLCG